jgi:hypothetical protein
MTTPVPMTQQQIDQLKVSLINTVKQLYTQFLEQLNSIPCNLEVKKIALKEFDTGYLWFKEGIVAFDFSQMQMVTPEPQPTDQTTPTDPTTPPPATQEAPAETPPSA